MEVLCGHPCDDEVAELTTVAFGLPFKLVLGSETVGRRRRKRAAQKERKLTR
jgi:hypothetical protein